MQIKTRKEQKFKERLKNILESEDLEQQRDLVRTIVAEHDIKLEDFAAALVFMSQSNPYQRDKKIEPVLHDNKDFDIRFNAARYKTVRYRFNVGSKHQLKQEEIENVLIEESGVEKKRIGRIDIRHHFTIVELPEGMPSDIFQLLNEIEIRQQKLNIKRIKPQRKFRNYRTKNQQK